MNHSEVGYRIVTGTRSRRTEGARTALAELERSVGGGKNAAARAAAVAGVSPVTWRRWRRGVQTPTGASLARLRGAQRRLRLSPAREAKIRGGGVSVTLLGTFTVSGDQRDREVDIGDFVDGDKLVDAYLRGDDAAMGTELFSAISDYVAGMTGDDFTGVTVS